MAPKSSSRIKRPSARKGPPVENAHRASQALPASAFTFRSEPEAISKPGISKTEVDDDLFSFSTLTIGENKVSTPALTMTPAGTAPAPMKTSFLYTAPPISEHPFLGLPTEIHFKIFNHACLDEGRTGCALSAVSKLVRQNSSEFRYTSVALHRGSQVIAFRNAMVSAMTDIPAHLRTVRHLFINTRQREEFNIYMMEEDDPIAQEYWRNRNLLRRAITDIMRIIAQSLTSLTYYAGDSQHDSPDKSFYNLMSISCSFPLLRELTIRGTLAAESCVRPGEIFAPSLEFVDVDEETFSATYEGNVTGWIYKFLVVILNLCPHLSHLRMSQPVTSDLIDAFTKIMAHAEDLSKSHHRTIRCWWECRGVSTSGGSNAAVFQRMRGAGEKEVAYLREVLPGLTTTVMRYDSPWAEAQALKQNWLDRMIGRDGQWSLTPSNLIGST